MAFALRVSLLLALLLCGSVAAVAAQLLEELSPAMRVRLTTYEAERISGTNARLTVDSLVLTTRGQRRALPLASVRRLQVSRGAVPRWKSALAGAGVGLIGGAAAGVLGATIPSLFSSPCDPNDPADELCFGIGISAIIGVVVGAPMGAAGGLVLGAAFPWEQWERLRVVRAPPPNLNVEQLQDRGPSAPEPRR